MTATRSWPENADRPNVTDGTETLAVSEATGFPTLPGVAVLEKKP